MKSILLTAAASLLSPALLHSAPFISEFLALNKGPDVDDQQLTSDWIEIQNPDATEADLTGWTLTDEPDLRAKWTFPAVTIPAGGRLVVRASGLDRRVPAQPLHTNFTLSGGGEFLGLYPPAGACASCFAPYPRQFAGYSYGRGTNGQTGYFAAPTINAENAATVLTGYTADTKFSVDRGFFSAPFTVALTCATPGAIIRYTTNGSEPDAASTAYSAPLNIAATTTLRARAFTTGLVPSDTDTQTYIFAANWVSQPAAPAGFPNIWGQGTARGFGGSELTFNIIAAYGTIASVRNNPAYSSLMLPALTQTLPVLCLTGNVNQIFGNNGIHGNLRSTDTEVPVGVEYFDPLLPSGTFSARALLQAHGGAVRDHPKMGFRVDFTGAQGSGALRFPLFAGSNSDTHEQLVLRPGGHDGFAVQGRGGSVDNNDNAFHATYLRDQFLRLTENEAGLLSPRGRYVHLCLNGLYWGLYDLHERPNAEFAAARSGGDPATWDVLHHSSTSTSGGNQVVDGTATAWDQLQALCTAPITTQEAYQELTALLGPAGYIDHMLIRMWGGDHDWLGPVFAPNETRTGTIEVTVFRAKNWYALRDARAATPRPWQFFTWDGELTMGTHLLTPESWNAPIYDKRKEDMDLTGVSRAGTPAGPWGALMNYAEWRINVADRAQRLLFNGGLLSPSVASARISGFIAQLDLPIVAESARWGNVVNTQLQFAGAVTNRTWTSTPVLTRDTHWRPETAWLRDTFCTVRAGILRNQLQARGLFPATDAPVVTLADGDLTFTSAHAGTILYSINGGDPREPFTGQTHPDALAYNAPVAAPAGRFTVRTRVFNGEWSALNEQTFTTAAAPTAGALAFTEVYYHPAPLTAAEQTAGFTDEDQFEFLEITNITGAAIALDSLRFASGIDLDFATDSSVRELAAGASLVLVSDAAAFTQRFGTAVTPAGVFQNGTRLSNSGERIKLVTAAGAIIAEFSYDDTGTWPLAADGGGHALELLAPASGTDESDGDHWRSDLPTPGTVRAALTYADWLRDYFTAEEIAAGTLTAAGADPDRDGIANLVEYLARVNPRRLSSNPLKHTQPAAGTLRFTWERRADATGVTAVVETSTALSGWVPAATAPGISTASASTARGTVEQTIEFTLPAAGPRRFARLRVTQP